MRIIVVVLVVVALFGAVARAQDVAPSADDAFQSASARSLFAEGVALARTGEYGEAADRFRRAQALRPSPSGAFNLASALIHEGGLVEAYEILESVLRDGGASPDLVASARRQRDAIAPRLARLTLRLGGPTTGVRVEIDAHELREAAIGVSLPIDPGAHDVRILREGRDAVHDHIELAEGESRELSLVVPLPEVSPEPPPLEPAPIDPPEVPLTPAPPAGNDDGLWIAVGVGIALAVGVATTTALLTLPQAPTPVSGNTMPPVLTW